NARPFTGHAGSTMPELFTCCAKMSTVLERTSCQVTIAPPVPSETMSGTACSEGAVQTATPPVGQLGSTAPEFSTCWAKMSGPVTPLRPSTQQTIAPPAPSEAIL